MTDDILTWVVHPKGCGFLSCFDLKIGFETLLTNNLRITNSWSENAPSHQNYSEKLPPPSPSPPTRAVFFEPMNPEGC